ncbi:MAG TPA: hypothetical protein VKR22_04495, partial [Acidimicrobiales bacterium]|nr:hypothetical protein [Acidimicrobiales bacterium]
ATRRLGRAALAFYAEPAGDLEPMPALTSPPRPALRTRRMVIGTVVPLALAMGVLCSLLPFSGHQHGLRWVTLAIGETVLALTFARLIRLTRTVGQPA